MIEGYSEGILVVGESAAYQKVPYQEVRSQCLAVNLTLRNPNPDPNPR